MTKAHCPAVAVPAVTPYDPAELAPLVEFLARGEAESRTFPRGTIVDGRVDLCKQSIGPDGARLVLDALRAGRPAVKAILFGTGAIGNAGAEAVAGALDDGVVLETVYLGCNRIDEAGIAVLAPAVARAGVAALWLKRNPLGVVGARRIAELIASGRSPTVLDVYNCELTEDGVVAIAEALAASRVEHVYLGGNAAGLNAARALGRMLARTSTLRTLQLSASPIGDAGALALAEGLVHNRSLRSLGLACCGIGPTGAAALTAALARHPQLVELDLGIAPSARALEAPMNGIGDRGAPAIAELVAANGPLRRLDVRENGITSRGALRVLEALHANHVLVELGLTKFVAKTIRRSLSHRLAANGVPSGMPAHVAAIQSVYRS